MSHDPGGVLSPPCGAVGVLARRRRIQAAVNLELTWDQCRGRERRDDGLPPLPPPRRYQ